MHDKLISGILFLVLAGAVIGSGLASVYQTGYVNGWDGYYYLVQVQSLNNTGVMHSPEYSLVYLPLMALHTITGDYVTSYKISAVLFKLLFVLSVFTLSFSLLRSVRDISKRVAFFTALFTATLSAMSPSLNYFFTQFPKNLLGFALFFFFMASVFSTGRRWRGGVKSGGLYVRTIGVILLFLAAFFTHRFSAVLSLCFLVLYFAPPVKHLLKHLWSSVGRKQARILIPVVMILLLLLVTLLIISNRLPLAPSVQDLERITGDLSLSPIFVPVSFVQSFGLFRISPAWIVEIFLAAVLPLLTCFLLLFRKRFSFLHMGGGYYILLIFSLTGLFPFFRFSLTGLSYRLFFGSLLMFPLACLPYIRLAVGKILGLRLDRGLLSRRVIPVLIFLALLALSLYTGRSYSPELHDPPYEYYEEIAGEAVEALSGVDWELIIAHGALAEIITYKFEVDALPWAPEEYFQRDRVWRITAGILRDEVSYYLSPEIADRYFIRLSGDYGLLREDQWEAFMESIADDPVMMEAVDTWRNPLQQRPMYLVKD